MAETYQEITAEFEKKSSELELDIFTSFDQLENGVTFCHDILHRFKRIVILKGFGDKAEEICFFKALKPLPESYLYYLYKVRNYQLLLPQGDIQKQQHFLNKEIRKINKFYTKHRELVYYMKRNRSDMDDHYFTRTANSVYFETKKHRYFDIDFSTPYDLIWARIKAMNLYIRFIEAERQNMETESINLNMKGRVLQWTASKTALIELAYALYTNGAISHGKEDLKSITTIFEKVFNTKLGNFYKTYAEMKARKGNRARFLKELATGLQEKMEGDDAF
ncbi:RteC domain-containing protein [Galbibacter orientalis]|uniref:RteC domain-containing protein n=1 Tax=Galbibacter orientalis TaxID=453852 RepID=UPI00307FDFA4